MTILYVFIPNHISSTAFSLAYSVCHTSHATPLILLSTTYITTVHLPPHSQTSLYCLFCSFIYIQCQSKLLLSPQTICSLRSSTSFHFYLVLDTGRLEPPRCSNMLELPRNLNMVESPRAAKIHLQAPSRADLLIPFTSAKNQTCILDI